MVKNRSDWRLGLAKTASYWLALVSLEQGRRLVSVIDPGSSGKLLATLGTSGVDDRATGAGTHPGPKTVVASALQIAGLKCSFHGLAYSLPVARFVCTQKTADLLLFAAIFPCLVEKSATAGRQKMERHDNDARLLLSSPDRALADGRLFQQSGLKKPFGLWITLSGQYKLSASPTHLELAVLAHHQKATDAPSWPKQQTRPHRIVGAVSATVAQ